LSDIKNQVFHIDEEELNARRKFDRKKARLGKRTADEEDPNN
jgi:hypothetical protein